MSREHEKEGEDEEGGSQLMRQSWLHETLQQQQSGGRGHRFREVPLTRGGVTGKTRNRAQSSPKNRSILYVGWHVWRNAHALSAVARDRTRCRRVTFLS